MNFKEKMKLAYIIMPLFSFISIYEQSLLTKTSSATPSKKEDKLNAQPPLH
jgi:hypothetical protein